MKKLLFTCLSLFLLLNLPLYAQIATYNATGLSGTTDALPPTTVQSGLRASAVSRSKGILGSSATDRLASTDWTSLAASPSLSDYYSFHLQIPAGQRLNITSLQIVTDRNTNGARSYVVRSSLDNFSANIGAIQTLLSTAVQTHNITTPTLNNITAGFIEFRLYGFNATNCTGTWRISSLVVNGNTSTFTDNTAPTISQIQVINPNWLLVRFNEIVQRQDIVNNNFGINNGIGNPQSTVLENPDSTTITLRLQNPLTIGQNYSLTVNSLRDITGNLVTNLSQNFTWNDTQQPFMTDCVVLTPNAIDAYFSEEVSEVSSQNSANYSICNEPAVVAAARDANNKSLVHLLLAGDLTENSLRTLTARNIADNQGNINLETAYSFMADTRRPTVDSLLTVANNRITLVFSEPVEKISAELVNNFDLSNNIGLPVSAIRDNANFSRIHLTFNGSMQQGQTYTLRVTRVADLNGNVMTTRNITFVYDKLPPTLDNLQVFENLQRIELTFSEPLDINFSNLLSNYEIRQGATVLPISSVWTCDKNFTTVFLRMAAPLPNDQNLSLTIRRIRDRQNNIIATNTRNFATTAPTLAKIHVLNATRLNLYFSEAITQATAENNANYTVVGIGNPTQARRNASNFSLIELTFSNNLPIGNPLVLQVNNLQDNAGNTISPTNSNFTYQNRISFAQIKASQLVDVKFTATVPTSQNANLYQIDNTIGTAAGAVRNANDSSLVNLLLSKNLQPSVNYTLTVAGFPLDCFDYLSGTSVSFSEDRNPPSVVSVVAVSPTDLVLTFSKNLDRTTAEALNHYQISLVGRPITAILNTNDNKIVALKLQSALQQNVTYTLTVERIKDNLGNTMPQAQNITFQRLLQPKRNELLITELMPDPDPVQKLPNTEYIELYNNSTQSFNLVGIKVTDGSTTITLPNYNLLPNDYVLLVPSNTKNSFATAIQPKIIETTWISLTNSGKQLSILDQDNQTIFMLFYSDNWYRNTQKANGGWSLEMINPKSSCLVQGSNWIASSQADGGTPTQQNSLWNSNPDKTAPQISSITVRTRNSIEIVFSEETDSLSMSNIANYQVNNLSNNQVSVLSTQRVQLTFSNNLDSATLYTLTVRNLKDCADNQGNSTATFGIGRKAQRHELVITEIMADETPRVGLPLSEWIEVYNRSNSLINLGAVRLIDDGTSVRLPNRVIAPKQYLVLSGTTKADSLQAIGVTSFPSLSNTGETLSLSDTSGYEIFSVTYSDTWYKNEIKRQGGWTLEMIDTENPCGEIENWTASTDARGGTPNAANSVARSNPDTTPPMIVNFQIIDSRTFIINFSEKMQMASIGNAANYTFDNNMTVNNVQVLTDRSVRVVSTTALNSSIIYTLTISNTSDCSGNIAQNLQQTIGIGRSPKPNELLITEIMADETPPIGLPLAEWLEIYNATDELLNLSGVRLQDDGITTTLPNATISPKSYRVLCSTTRIDSLAKVAPRNTLVGVTSFPSLNNTGETLTLRNAQNEVLHSVTYSDTWYKDDTKKQGGWTLEMIDVNNLCGEIENWTASTAQIGGTPAQRNAATARNIDTTPPILANVRLLNSSLLAVSFSEKMDTTTLLLNNNYSFSPVLPIQKIILIDNKTVNLQLANSLNTNILYELTVNNVADCAGNKGSSIFTLGIGTSPEKYELLITEIFADPSPVVQLPEREYIELYNNSGKLLNLETVQLQDETAIINLPNTVIRPNEYIILCSTTSVALFETFLASNTTKRRVIGVTGFPSLNNTGEKLTLRSGGKFLHAVNYTDQWYGDAVKQQGGWALEMIDTNNPCGESANWTASKDARGGTPAQSNSVRANLVDTTPPILLIINVISPTQVQVVFNENLDSLSAVTLGNYALNNGVRITAVQWADDKTVSLNLVNSLNNSLLYELQVSNIRDCSGNVLQLVRQSFGVGETPQLYEMVMTELMPDPSPVVANLPESEYIELYNRTDKVLNLGAATLSNGTTTARLGFVPILPKSYILLVPSTSVENFRKLLPQATIVGLSPWVSLANDKAVLTLRNANNRLVHDVSYTLDFYRDADKKDGGWSMEMIDENYPCLGNANWQASTDRNGGTPAQRNAVRAANPDTQSPVLQRVDVVDAQTLLVIFNERLDSLSTLSGSYQISPIITVQNISWVATQNNAVLLRLSAALQAKTVYDLAVNNLRDCSGNWLATAQRKIFTLPERGEVGEILLNEILFNPPVNGVDFVEIYNTSDKYIDLKGWQLARKTKGVVEQQRIVSTQTLIIAPKSYMVFTPDVQQLKTQYPQGADSVWVATSLPTYTDDTGTVVLLRADNQEIDLFDYDEKYHFKLLDNKEGVSLERIDFAAPTNDRNNWHSAAAPQYGTAGYRNSQAVGAVNRKAECFWVENAVITPDGDGFQDFALLHYGCNQTGNLANVQIFDREGRLVKTILQNQLLAAEGFFRWEGDMDNGRKAPIGYYVIHIQTFSMQGKQEDYQVKVVVGAR